MALIYIVEDDKNIREIEAFALKKLMSNHLLSKSEGQSAVQDFRRRHPYCIETLPLLIKLKKLR